MLNKCLFKKIKKKNLKPLAALHSTILRLSGSVLSNKSINCLSLVIVKLRRSNNDYTVLFWLNYTKKL